VNEMCDVVIIGAGPSGPFYESRALRMNREHIIPNRGRTGQTWRGRWDSFLPLCFPTGRSSSLERRTGPRSGMDSWRERVLWSICVVSRILQCPGARGSFAVQSLQRGHDGRFPAEDRRLVTSTARSVVLATGGFRATPSGRASEFPSSLTVIDAERPTPIHELCLRARSLVIGVGRPGGQIA